MLLAGRELSSQQCFLDSPLFYKVEFSQIKSARKSCVRADTPPHLFGQSPIGFSGFLIDGSWAGLQRSQVPPSGAGPFSSPWRGGEALQWCCPMKCGVSKSLVKEQHQPKSFSSIYVFSLIPMPILGHPLFQNKFSYSWLPAQGWPHVLAQERGRDPECSGVS